MAPMVLCGGVAQPQIAPGPLSRAHADLGGITGCASCHDFGARRLKCLECHTEIRHRVEAATGFHWRAYKHTPGATDCARCHAEHRGAKIDFVPLDRKSFDHGAQTGFKLEGRHLEQNCEACHTSTRIAVAARQEIRMKDLNQSFLGLRRECTSCHEEPHQRQLGTDCLGCHVPQAWKPASRFNHSRASFQLTGMHQQVPCAKCHARARANRLSEKGAGNEAAEAGQSPRTLLFKGLTYDGCRSCHADQHRGAFEAVKLNGRCEGCHNTGGWKTNRPGTGFDHSLTKFRLVGKHASLVCGKCHKESNFSRPVAHELCRNCHEGPHGGQFALRAAGSDCSSCHRTTDFKPSLYDRETHIRGVFSLVGKHAALPCSKCHQPEGPGARYKIGKQLCSECHAEPHGGEFASAPYNNRCDTCHTPAGFAATSFTIERHAQTSFPLSGKHAAVACHKCHKPQVPAASRPAVDKRGTAPQDSAVSTADEFSTADARRQYRFASRACEACHPDPHRIDPQAHLPCTTCHTPQGWRLLQPFDHSITRFKLEGSHKGFGSAAGCARCHVSPGQAGPAITTAPVFSRIPAQCSACHAAKDKHGGQFSSPGNRGTDCAQCHVPAGWDAGGFSHETAQFVLNTAHRGVPCAKCHKERDEPNGRVVRAYRGTPVECLKCHL